MSKIDELKRVYIDELCASDGDVSAGIAAVVRALRDECDRVLPCDRKFSRNQVWDVFEEILGDAGDEVAYTGGMYDLSVSPAAPAPAERSDATAVCEWVCVAEGTEYDIYDVGCDSESFSAWQRPERCTNCGKPIKFTEAK